jgi:hypothetical protein
LIGGGRENVIGGQNSWSVIVGGRENSITGNTQRGTIVGGIRNKIISIGTVTQPFIGGGEGNIVSGNKASVVGGSYNYTYANETFIGGGRNNYIGVASTGSLVVGGDTNKIYGSGDSGILGGNTNIISGLAKSFIIGSNITAVSANTTHVNNLNIYDTPSVDNSIDNFLVRDTDGTIKTRSLSDSGSCITDLYVTNIHGCSPITINDTLNFNISGSTFFTDNNSNLDVGVDADPSNGDLFKIYFGTSYFGIRQTGSTNSTESVFLGNDTLGDVLQVTTEGIIIEQELTNTIYDIGTISGSTNLDIKNGNVQMLTLNGDLTLNALSASTTESGDVTLHLYQDGVGGHSVTKGTNILTESGAAITVTSGASSTDTLFFKTDDNGKYRLISHTKDFS